ncbi:MAG TPA: hypothetical protein VEZ20_16580 [Allosphingosinicella sp.]|nr:hypothetical protein [Allosphingosinicella sp.]
MLRRTVPELPIVLVLCAWSGYALWKRGPAERASAIFLLCAIELSLTRNLIYALPLCASCAYAFWHGGAPEKLVAAALFYAVTLTHFAWSEWALSYAAVEVGILVVDVAALLAYAAVALFANRFWPIWFTSLGAIAVAGHIIKMVDPDLPRWGYWFAIVFTSYPMLPMLAFATWCHRRRLSRNGFDPDWSASLLPGRAAGRAGAVG